MISSYDKICRYKRDDVYSDTKETNLPHKIEFSLDIDERNQKPTLLIEPD